jgi:predicted ATPase
LAEVRRLYDSRIDGGLVQLFAQDQLVASLMAEAWALFQLGYPDQAIVAAQASVKRAVEIGHAHSHAYALGHSLAWTHIWRREFAAAALAGANALAIGRAHDFPTIVALGGVAHAVALAHSDNLAEVPAAMIEATAAYHRIGAKLQPGLMGFAIATVRLALGELVAARAAGDEALAECSVSGTLWIVAGLHILRADLARTEGDMAAAERALLDALEVARRQEARSWELRASTSLARLWAEQGERQKAHDLLAPIHAWFTEGFDTPDLIEAKALLDQLG